MKGGVWELGEFGKWGPKKAGLELGNEVRREKRGMKGRKVGAIIGWKWGRMGGVKGMGKRRKCGGRVVGVNVRS